MSSESQHTQHAGDIPTITSLCKECSALDLVPLLLKEGRYAKDLEDEKARFTTIKDILGRPECDLCQYVLRTMMSRAAKIPSFAELPPLTMVGDAVVGIRVRLDFKNEVLPCRVLELTLENYMGKSLFCELHPACPDIGALRGTKSTVARIPSSTIDPLLVKEWIHTCQKRHGKTCRPRAKRSFDFDLWVIDVKDMKLSKLPSGAEYLALSYVWGQATAFVTTKANLGTRSGPGGLRHVLQISSRVVRDAVELTGGMGMQYIWIDQLCVIQDDCELLDRTLRAMGDIYHHATATVVAASGSDANVGLAGVEAGSRDVDRHLVLAGSGQQRFALIETSRTVYLDDTTYLKRAWTYQEYFFGMRRIIFRDGCVNFKCPVAHWQEELDVRYLSWPTGLDHGVDTTGVTQSVTWGIERFNTDNVASTQKLGGDPRARMIEFMVHEFTERELTRDGDILNAFAGVGAHLSGWSGSPLRLGLSEKYFFGCLLWKMRGESGWDRPFASKKRPGFPTWSWASRYGPVHCSGNFYESCFDDGTNVCPVDHWAPAYVWMDFCFANADGDFQRLDWCETRDRYIDISRLLRGESGEPLSTFLVEPPGKSDARLPNMRENTLFFRTVSITRSMKAGGRYRTYWACGSPRSIWDSQGREIGCVYVDDIDFATWEGEIELLLISLVERIPAPWENRRRGDDFILGDAVGSDIGRQVQQQEDTGAGKRRVGYFNVMWVIDDDVSPGFKKRLGTGVVLSEFVIGQVEEELRRGIVDVFLF